jgi:hypothetical protein
LLHRGSTMASARAALLRWRPENSTSAFTPFLSRNRFKTDQFIAMRLSRS